MHIWKKIFTKVVTMYSKLFTSYWENVIMYFWMFIACIKNEKKNCETEKNICIVACLVVDMQLARQPLLDISCSIFVAMQLLSGYNTCKCMSSDGHPTGPGNPPLDPSCIGIVLMRVQSTYNACGYTSCIMLLIACVVRC